MGGTDQADYRVVKGEKSMKVMSVFGTRPEAIKMCPLIKRLQEHTEIESVVCLTGQHEEMLMQVIDIFSDQGRLQSSYHETIADADNHYGGYSD